MFTVCCWRCCCCCATCTAIKTGWCICLQWKNSEKSTLIWKWKAHLFTAWHLHSVWKYHAKSAIQKIFSDNILYPPSVWIDKFWMRPGHFGCGSLCSWLDAKSWKYAQCWASDKSHMVAVSYIFSGSNTTWLPCCTITAQTCRIVLDDWIWSESTIHLSPKPYPFCGARAKSSPALPHPPGLLGPSLAWNLWPQES